MARLANSQGISSPYEDPDVPELVVNTFKYALDDSVQLVISKLLQADTAIIQASQV